MVCGNADERTSLGEANGDTTESGDEAYARTGDCYLAGDALRVRGEDRSVYEHRASSLERSASACCRSFRTEQDHRVHEPVQSRSPDLSRGLFAGCRTQELTGCP